MLMLCPLSIQLWSQGCRSGCNKLQMPRSAASMPPPTEGAHPHMHCRRQMQQYEALVLGNNSLDSVVKDFLPPRHCALDAAPVGHHYPQSPVTHQVMHNMCLNVVVYLVEDAVVAIKGSQTTTQVAPLLAPGQHHHHDILVICCELTLWRAATTASCEAQEGPKVMQPQQIVLHGHILAWWCF